jgi:HAD superfamily hydrolase (TIGR01450 family)
MIPAGIRSFVFDIDGCVAVEGEPVEGVLEALAELQARGTRFVFFTNDTLRSPGQWRERMAAMGLDFPDLQVITAGQVLAQLVAERHPGGRVLLLGTEAVAEELARRNVEVLTGDDAEAADAVLVTRDPEVHYRQLVAGLRALLGGAAFYTSSMARTIPARDGPVLGTGAITKALEFAARREPVAAGKPSSLAGQQCLKLAGFDPAETAFVGDDAELDIATAKLVGCFSILVLTGTTGAEQVASLSDRMRPDLVLSSAADIPDALSHTLGAQSAGARGRDRDG